jgi:glycerol-3-phosphate O-acyltransferase/dihydroxyacetone phosphate acyltransferase
MARNILWDDERNVPLKDWVEISQRLAQMFVEDEEVRLKDALTKYYALLHHTNTKHAILLSLLPISASSILDIPPPNSVPASAILIRSTLSILSSLPVSLIRLILFLPPFLLHFPGYFTGPLLSKCLATPGEEEGPAQFKAVGAGLGIGANIALALGLLWKTNNFRTVLGLGNDDGRALLKRIVGLVGAVYLGVVVLVKWHKLLVGGACALLMKCSCSLSLIQSFE